MPNSTQAPIPKASRDATQPATGGSAPGTAPTIVQSGVRSLSGVYAKR